MSARRIPVWSRVAFAVLLPILAYRIWDYVESRRLTSRVHMIQLRGEPTASRYTVPMGDAARAERLYRAAAALSTWTDGRSNPRTLESASREVAENQEALGLADQAASLPFVNFLGGTSYNLQVGELVRLARLCELRAAVLAKKGQGDDALSSFSTEARLTQVLDVMTPPPLAVMPDFRGLSSVVEKAPPSSLARNQAAEVFASIDHDNRLRESIISYRTALLARPSYGGTFLGSPGPLSARAIVRALDDFDRLIAASERPWPQRIDAVKAIGTLPASPTVFMSAADRAGLQKTLNGFVTRIVGQVRTIRCARIIVSPTPLDVIDPLTGSRLDVSNCHI